jgi:hypothetical protein
MRVTTRSNPTGLQEIERSRIGVLVSQDEGKRFFNVTGLDLSGLGLDGSMQVICVARAGNTRQRYSLGTVASWCKDKFALDAVDPAAPLRFRFLIHEPSSPRLKASAERIRFRDVGQADSLLPMEPAALGEELWRLQIVGEDGPVLLYNSKVFPNAAGVENYLPFACLVLPQALREVAGHICRNTHVLDEEAWAGWEVWFDSLGISVPETEDNDWVDRVVNTFCERHRFASKLGNHFTPGEGND